MKRFSLFAIGALAVGVLFVAACADEAGSADPSADHAEMLAALTVIDGAEFHAMDETLNGPEAAIDPAWLGRTRNGRIAVASATWPEDLRPLEQAFMDAAASLAEALEADDAVGAAEPAAATHDAQHELSVAGWNHLAEQAGLTVDTSEH